jgi:hypothetical protein
VLSFDERAAGIEALYRIDDAMRGWGQTVIWDLAAPTLWRVQQQLGEVRGRRGDRPRESSTAVSVAEGDGAAQAEEAGPQRFLRMRLDAQVEAVLRSARRGLDRSAVSRNFPQKHQRLAASCQDRAAPRRIPRTARS